MFRRQSGSDDLRTSLNDSLKGKQVTCVLLIAVVRFFRIVREKLPESRG